MSQEDIRPLLRAAEGDLAIERSDSEWANLIAGFLDRAQALYGISDAGRAEFAWMIARDLEAHRQAIQRVEAALKRWREADVQANGPVRFGDTFYTYGPKTKTTLVDGDALEAWLDAAAERLGERDLTRRVFRHGANELRITALRGIAERLAAADGVTGEEETADYVRAIENTFVDTERQEKALQEKPISKAPKYAQRLRHGERVGTFTNPEETTDGSNNP